MPTGTSNTPQAQSLSSLAALKGTQVPAEVLARLERFVAELVAGAGANLASLVLFGGVARGRYRVGQSDINVLIVLNDDSAASLAAIAPAVKSAFRAIGVEPMICRADKMAANAAVFPTKFLDIKDRHILLAGREMLGGLSVPRERIAWRTEQELRNMAIRLRRRCVEASGDAAATAQALVEIARPLALELAWLLRLEGKATPEEDRTRAIFEVASATFGYDAGALAGLADIREDTGSPGKTAVDALSERVLRIVTAAADRAQALGSAAGSGVSA